MEMSQGNSLCSYLKQTKMLFFSFFYKIREQQGVTGPAWRGCYQWEGDNVGKWWRMVNMVQILSTHVCKWKNETCGNCSRNEGGGIKENDGGVNSNMIYLIYCKNFCKCLNVPPPSTTIKINLRWGPVAHTCNPKYSGGRDQEDWGLKPAWTNSLRGLSQKKSITKEMGQWSGSRWRPWVQAPIQQINKFLKITLSLDPGKSLYSLCHKKLVLSFLEFHINWNAQYVFFCIWLTSWAQGNIFYSS
jgi:hypothetical protein